MTRKTTAPSGCDPDRGSQCANTDLLGNYTNIACLGQEPEMLSTLRAALGLCIEYFMCSERADDRVASAAIDCCNFLLIEAERLEGRRR